MAILIYSTNSHRKIAHLSHCKILKRIPKTSRRTFTSLEEAQAHGYRLCRCCPAIAVKYRKERKQVDQYCRDNGFICKLLDNGIHIISKHDCWRLIVNGSNKSLFLYHKNTDKSRGGSRSDLVPGFHSQKFRTDTILGYLRYISSHDAYREEHPCTEQPPAPMDRTIRVPDWVKDKYGGEYLSLIMPKRRPARGTRRYRKEQAKKKRQKRHAAIIRVNALLDELAAIRL